MSEVDKQVLIRAPIERVWDALTDPKVIRQWMGGKVKVDLRPGGAYAIFDGATTGRFTLIEKPRTLEYSWRQEEWDAGWPDSVVRWELTEEGGATRTRLRHSDFPNNDELTGHDEGWDAYFIDPMKAWLESDE